MKINGKFYERIVETPDNCINYEILREQCHDCGVDLGQNHHFGCDMERCPICLDHQFITCRCIEQGSNNRIHHIIPREKGGTDELFNLRLLCRSCHRIEESNPFRKIKDRITLTLKYEMLKRIRKYGSMEDTYDSVLNRILDDYENIKGKVQQRK